MEKEDLVEFERDAYGSGPAKKTYRVTDNGLNRLTEHKTYMEIRIKNLKISPQQVHEPGKRREV